MVPSLSRVSRVQERGTCRAGRSQGVLGGPDYFCLGAVPRNEQGGVKERKECFSQGQIKTKPQMREKTNNIKSHNIAREGIINNQRAATESMTVIDFQNQEIWLLKTKS